MDLVDEGMIDAKRPSCAWEPKQPDALLHRTLTPPRWKAAEVVGKGLAASPGAACGRVVFTAEDAWRQRRKGVVLVRLETSPRTSRACRSPRAS